MVKHFISRGKYFFFCWFSGKVSKRGIGFSHLSQIGFVSNDIPERRKKIVSENSALPLDSDSKPWSVILKRCSRGVYSILNKYSQTPKSVCKWNQLFAELNWGKYSVNRFLQRKIRNSVSVQDFAQIFYQRDVICTWQKLQSVVLAAEKKKHYFTYFGRAQLSSLSGLMSVHWSVGTYKWNWICPWFCLALTKMYSLIEFLTEWFSWQSSTLSNQNCKRENQIWTFSSTH